MKNKLFIGSTFMILCGMVALPVCQTALAAEGSAETAAGRLPSDLARASAGTTIQVRAAVADDGAARGLIGEDATRAYPLAAGRTSMILALSKIEVVNHFDFVDAGAEGKVTVSVSSAKLPFDSADWRVVATAQAFEGRQLIPCDLGSVDARYVKVDFDTARAGSISGFNLFGMGSLGRPLVSKGSFHVSLRTAADNTVDANFSYDPANPAPKVVADLGSSGELKHLACTYEASAGQLDFYLVDNGGEGTETLRVGLNYVAAPTLQPVSNDADASPADGANVLAGHRAIYSVDIADKTAGQAGTDLKDLKGRYLVAAFRPAARHGDFKDFKDFKNSPRDAFKDTAKDGKQAPVFPAFTNAPPGFGNPPNNVNPPLLPPPLGAGSP